MFNKTQLSLFLTLFSTCALAATHGVYFGAGAGPDYANIDSNGHIRQVNPTKV